MHFIQLNYHLLFFFTNQRRRYPRWRVLQASLCFRSYTYWTDRPQYWKAPNVATMVEESERCVCCDNEHFDDVINCDHIRYIHSNIQEDREKGKTCGTVP